MSSDAERLLVLGGSGFLGAHLLAQAGFARVFSASRRPQRCPASVAGEGYESIAWDAIEPGALQGLLEHCQPTHVVLAAALSRPGPAEADPELARVLNVELPDAVASACHERGARLVHVSTDLVFGAGKPRGERYTEDDEPAPVHVYGRTKAEGEERVLAAAPDALVVRVPLLYGESGGRGLGASDDLAALLARGESPGLFLDEWRTPLDVSQAAAAILEALRKPITGRLHVAGPTRLTRLELGLAFLEASGLSAQEASERVRGIHRQDVGQEHFRPADVCLDTRRARALLDTPLLSPRDSLTVR